MLALRRSHVQHIGLDIQPMLDRFDVSHMDIQFLIGQCGSCASRLVSAFLSVNRNLASEVMLNTQQDFGGSICAKAVRGHSPRHLPHLIPQSAHETPSSVKSTMPCFVVNMSSGTSCISASSPPEELRAVARGWVDIEN